MLKLILYLILTYVIMLNINKNYDESKLNRFDKFIIKYYKFITILLISIILIYSLIFGKTIVLNYLVFVFTVTVFIIMVKIIKYRDI